MSAIAPTSGDRRRLGERLVDAGVLSDDQLRIALTEQAREPGPLGRLLIRLGFVTEAVLREQLGEALGQESIDPAQAVPDRDALACIPKEQARRLRILPINYRPGERLLAVAMADPCNVITLDRIRALLDSRIRLRPLLAGESEIEAAIDRFYGYELSVDGILHEIETGEVDDAGLHTGAGEYSQPLVRLVDAILADAVKRDASDIHFEPEAGFVRIRYRIDGVLRQIRSLHAQFWSPIAVRLKVMSSLNIAETRAPQDGRITLRIGGHAIDFRVSVVPTIHGENLVLRVLDRHKGIRPLASLGFDDSALGTLERMMARPEGIILVTGPTGSGKTTTLYSMLSHRDDERVNIVTLEDPVEYPMPRVRQSAVNEAAGLDFASGIRNLMRQDPDIMLVGEIRDEPTAGMAFRAAMTGHQVYSTLHTNSALGAIPRLRDIGILPDVIAGNLIGVMGQRLARRLCGHCRQPYRPAAHERRLLALDAGAEPTLYRASGCAHCDGRGYNGRFALLEVLRMDDDLDDLIARGSTRKALADAAHDKGFRTLAHDGARHVLAGTTSLDEVARVIDLTGRV